MDLAREANLPACHLDHPKALQRFADLVADHVYAEYLEQPPPSQTGVISITISEPIAYLCENAVGHKYFRWKKAALFPRSQPVRRFEQNIGLYLYLLCRNSFSHLVGFRDPLHRHNQQLQRRSC